MEKGKFLLVLCLMSLVVMVLGSVALACTTVIVGKDASVDRSVMTSHTCDGSYDARIQVISGETFEAGAMAPVYKGLCYDTIPGKSVKQVGEIPQVKETYTYYHIAYPFMNEHQVMIGEATFWGRNDSYNSAGMMVIEQLEVFGLQRAKTARECIQVMGALAEKYGYGDGGETLTVIDANEAWVFEIVGPGPLWTPDSGELGAIWAARRVPDDHVSVAANRSRIGELNLNDPDNYMASANVMSYAEEMGWWDPSTTFRFWEAYNPSPYGADFYQRRREWRALSMLAPSLNLDPNLDPDKEQYPFSIKPDKRVSVQDVMAIFRDYYAGTEFDLTKGLAAGPFGNPNRYATPRSVKPADKQSSDWERAISMFRCSYSFVGQARSWLPNPIGGVLWFGEDAPYATCYVPFYCGNTEVPESFASGSRAFFDKDSAWWAFDYVANLADLKFSYMIQDINAVQNEFEGEFFAMQPAVEEAAKKMYYKNPDLAIKYLTEYSNNAATKVVDRWWDLADELIYKYNDGYVDNKSVGYPTWWLEAVDYGY